METVRGGTQTGGRKRTVEDRFYAWRESNRCTTCVRRKNDPALAQQVMAKVESFIMKDQATLPPGRIYSCVVVLDENGEIAHAAGSSGGGNISGPTEEELRQFEVEQAAKKKRREEYARLSFDCSI